MDPNSGKLQMIQDAEIARLQGLTHVTRDLTVKEKAELQMIQDAEIARLQGLIHVTRDLTVKEKADMQIRLYSPCGCGSGKKFKFCCYTGGSK